jgi:hypothetical protein
MKRTTAKSTINMRSKHHLERGDEEDGQDTAEEEKKDSATSLLLRSIRGEYSKYNVRSALS